MQVEKDLFGKCPYTTAQKVLSGKWSIIILYHLGIKTMRFGELQRQLRDIAQYDRLCGGSEYVARQ